MVVVDVVVVVTLVMILLLFGCRLMIEFCSSIIRARSASSCKGGAPARKISVYKPCALLLLEKVVP